MLSAHTMQAPPLRICLVSAEVAPFAKTGGLADVSAALGRYLAAAGHDVRLFLPFYSSIDTAEQELSPVDFLRGVPLTMGGRSYRYSLFTARLPGTPTWVYLVNCPALYDRPGIYTGDADDARRFAFLSRAALECCQRMAFPPQVVHCNDWHTALIPVYLRAHYSWDRLFARTRTILTLHNVAYQGVFPAPILAQLDLADHTALLAPEDLAVGRINFLRTGIRQADVLTTVSPTHAREIQTDEYGMGLQADLRRRADRLVGILNGIDTRVWDPAADSLIAHRYSAADLAGKARNKLALLGALGLPAEPGPAVLGIVSRLTAQKGFDLLFDPLPHALSRRGVKLVVLGSGEERYCGFFAELARRFPRQAAFHRGYSEKLAHLIEAGADIFLMPSRYEPSGLNQMYSLRYGTPPLVRRTGGLADAVEPYDPRTGRGTGFVFEHFAPEGFAWALDLALEVYRHKPAWRRLMRNGMARDFSWETQIKTYERLYRQVAAA